MIYAMCVRHALAWGLRTVMLKCHGFYCIPAALSSPGAKGPKDPDIGYLGFPPLGIAIMALGRYLIAGCLDPEGGGDPGTAEHILHYPASLACRPS